MTTMGDDPQQRIAQTSRVLTMYEQSATLRRIRREVYGDDYAEEADPSSPTGPTLTQLRRIVRELRVGPAATIVDLGCGRGGPGLWLARETGAALVGIDLVPLAVERATARMQALGLQERARFVVADMTATGLPAEAFDGAVSIYALQAVPDKAAAVREVARLLRPGARFVFATIEGVGFNPFAGGVLVRDHRPLLEAAEFTIDVYEEQPEWPRQMRAVTERIGRVALEALSQEIGEEGAQGWLRFAAARVDLIEEHQEREVLIAAHKS